MTTIAWCVLTATVFFPLGVLLGTRQEGSIWALRAWHRTPVYHRGKFYYVVPEREYVDREIDLMRARRAPRAGDTGTAPRAREE